MIRNEIRLAGLEVLTVMVMNRSLLLGYNAVKFVESADVSEEHVTSIFTVEVGDDMFLRNVGYQKDYMA
jgi:hypothetical protein